MVGRITAQIDFAYNQFHGSRTGMFGFLEFEDDPEVLAALLDRRGIVAAGARVRPDARADGLQPERGRRGADRGLRARTADPPELAPALLPAALEEAGLEKAMDLLSWDLSIDDRASMKPIIEKLAKRCREKYGITVRKMTRRGLRKDLDKFAEVYNSAWSENWGFVPYSKEDLDAYALDLQIVFSPEWFMVAEKDGETIAMAITVMDANQLQNA